jgi:hypothetical protein
MVYFETGRLPMKIIRYFRMFKFCFKVLHNENIVLLETVVMNYITNVIEWRIVEKNGHIV